MKTILLSSDLTAPFKADKNNTLYVVDDGASITVSGTDAGLDASNEAVGRNFKIFGQIKADMNQGQGLAIGDFATTGGGGSLTIGKGAAISGSVGVASMADGEKIVNAGSISGQMALGFSGEDTHIRNSGTISGIVNGIMNFEGDGVIKNSGTIGGNQVGIYFSSSGIEAFKVINTGTIAGGDGGIAVISGAGSRSVLINHGEITGATFAYGSNDASIRDHVRNSGSMSGTVLLGGGNDTYDGRGGHANEVKGGSGDDTFIVSDSLTALKEDLNGGADTVKAATTWALGLNFENLTLMGKAGLTATGNSQANVLKGNAGDNILYGMDGDDILSGGKGNDILFGGADYDTFVFSKGFGHDHVSDFDTMRDRIDLRGIAGIDSYADIQALAKDTVAGVDLRFGNGDVLSIDGIDIVDLAQDRFMF